MFNKDLVVIRGGGDIATGIACRLFNSGFKVIILEISQPSVIRRTVAFAQAVYDNEVVVEGIHSRLVDSWAEALKLSEQGIIPVVIDEDLKNIKGKKPYVLVDSILAKVNLGTSIDMAEIVIGIGPGFTANVDVDAVIETDRGHYLGKVILNGSAQPNTGIPGVIGGYSIERVIKAPAEGHLQVIKDIGSEVESGETIAIVGGVEVKATIDGILRGMIHDGYYVHKNMKIADVDPRANVEHCFEVSDKARAIGGGVLEAILYLTNNKGLSHYLGVTEGQKKVRPLVWNSVKH